MESPVYSPRALASMQFWREFGVRAAEFGHEALGAFWPRPQTHKVEHRLAWSALVLVVVGIAGYYGRNLLVGWIEAPMTSTGLYIGAVGDSAVSLQAVTLALGLTLSPLIIWNYVAAKAQEFPQLTPKLISFVAAAAVGLTAATAIVGHSVVLPSILHLIGQTNIADLHAYITVNSYRAYATIYLCLWSAVSLLPLLVLYIYIWSPYEPKVWGKYRLPTIVATALIALVLPWAPDPLSKVVLFLTVYLAYELAFAAIYLAHPVLSHPVPPSTAAPDEPTAQRLPLAIAVPHRPTPKRPAMDPLRAPARQPVARSIDDSTKRLVR